MEGVDAPCCVNLTVPFHRPGLRLSLPVYLDEQVQSTLAALAQAKGMELSVLVNDLLKNDIELIEVAR